MPLLEIITHKGTAPEVAAAAMAVGTRQGKTAIFVKDVPGFYVNRALAPFMTEVSLPAILPVMHFPLSVLIPSTFHCLYMPTIIISTS
jgi:hypothetical protein